MSRRPRERGVVVSNQTARVVHRVNLLIHGHQSADAGSKCVDIVVALDDVVGGAVSERLDGVSSEPCPVSITIGSVGSLARRRRAPACRARRRGGGRRSRVTSRAVRPARRRPRRCRRGRSPRRRVRARAPRSRAARGRRRPRRAERRGRPATAVVCSSTRRPSARSCELARLDQREHEIDDLRVPLRSAARASSATTSSACAAGGRAAATTSPRSSRRRRRCVRRAECRCRRAPSG